MRLIDADELLKIFEERLRVEQGGDGTKERWAYMAWLRSLNAVKNAPTTNPVEALVNQGYVVTLEYDARVTPSTHTDLVNVVRCKDCKFCVMYRGALKGCDYHEIYVNEDDYCSYGERIE